MCSKGFDLRVLRTDNGPEMLSSRFQIFLTEHRVGWERSMPYVHAQLGMQERRWGILIPVARTMLAAANMSGGHWAKAVVYAAYLVNRTWVLEREGEKQITPYERLTGKKFDVTKLRVFGCDAWVLRPPECRESKMEPVSIKGKFVGMARNGAGYIVYAAGRHYESKHVRFKCN